MYKLLIENNNVWSILDLGDDKPAMNYQANNIAELKSREVNYSQALKLPPTKNNCRTFLNSDSIDVVTDFPYQKHNCRLYSNDSVLAGSGSFLILDKVNEFFEVQILSGNADLFTQLGINKMSDLDLGSAQIGVNTILEAINTSTYCIPVASFLRGGATKLNQIPEHAYPFVYLKPAIENMLKSNGYNLPDGKLETNLTDEQWKKKAINVCSLTPGSDSLTIFDASATANVYGASSNAYFLPITINKNGNNCLVYNSILRSADYTPIANCNLRIQLSSKGYDVGKSLTILIKNITQGSEIISHKFTVETIGQVYIFDSKVGLNKGDIIRATFYDANINYPAGFENSLSFTEMMSDTVPAGGKLDFSPNLGFDTQLDFFKMFVQLFGLTVSVDNETKVIQAYTMQKLYDNKPIAKDWSKKLHDVKTNELNFQTLTATYGQNNFIKFNDNTLDLVSDSGMFAIQNNTLPITKDLFGIKLEAGLDKDLGSNTLIANIPLEEVDTDGVITFKGGKPHIVDIVDDSVTIAQSGSVVSYIGLKVATHAKAQSFVDQFYPGLISILSNAKYPICEMYLTDQDIEDFDPFVPVYILKYGSYFYVNKINNYISKTLTKVELIKL